MQFGRIIGYQVLIQLIKLGWEKSMNIEISINFAYLVLLVGALMALFALLTPGTGIFELGALAGLVVASWAAFSLPINVWALVVLVLGVIPFILAIHYRNQRIYLLISVLAIMLGSAYLFQGTKWWLPGVNPVLAIVGSLSAGGLLWLMAVKVLEAKATTPSHDMSDIIGAVGEARTNIYHDGSVYVYGEMWTAHSDKPIKAGTNVRVVAREGLILQVEIED
jgi:membrane-bound serine protease (ClpP class)